MNEPKDELIQLIRAHDEWRLKQCINLIPSENISSEAVRQVFLSDLGHRYSLRREECFDFPIQAENFYRGTRYIDQIVEMCRELACKVFNAKFAFPEPLSGHHAAIIVLASLCRPGDLILAIDERKGGYPGYMPQSLPQYFNLRMAPIPFNHEEGCIEYEELEELIASEKPRLVILGASTILFPYDIRRIKRSCDEVGALIVYDASHVLGLIAGGAFQPDPLGEGVDVLFGSTHKTFFGPQGGIIVTNNDLLAEILSKNLKLKMVDNPHFNRIAALAIALCEHLKYGREYAKQVIMNAKALGRALDEEGVPMMYKRKDFTSSHQLLVFIDEVERLTGRKYHALTKMLEQAYIIVDNGGRLGTQEITRLGMKVHHMKELASLIRRVIIDQEDPVKVRKDVLAFRAKFQEVKYC